MMKKILLFCFSIVLFGCTQTTNQAQEKPIGQEAYQTFIDNHTAIENTSQYDVYEVYFTKNNQKIYGQLFLPKTYQKQFGTVLIGHGFNSHYGANLDYAKALAQNGIVAYVFDFIGGSTISKSDGQMTDMSIMTQRDDMEAILDQITQFEFIDKKQLFLMGDSQGGLVSALLGGKRANDIKGLVLVYPAFRLPAAMQRLSSSLDKLPDTLTIMNATIGKKYVLDVQNLDVQSEVSQFTKPVLIVQGDSDPIVPLKSSQEAVTWYNDARLEVIKGGSHGFDEAQTKIANEKIVQYVKSRMNAK